MHTDFQHSEFSNKQLSKYAGSSTSKLWIGRVLTALPLLFLAVDLEARQPAAEPDFASLHDRLSSDLRVAEIQEHFRSELDRLREHFDVGQAGLP